MMTKCGAEYPDIVDLVTSKEEVCTLFIVQNEDIKDEVTIEKLLAKIHNYLDYGFKGQLSKEYPDMTGMNKRIQIDLQHEPKGTAKEFLKLVGPYVESEGMEFVVNVIK